MTLRSTSTAADAKRPATQRDPLGPDSLTWKYFGDLRTGMLGVWIGAIQNMYPELGAGVEDHSILLREPLQRVARSVYPIMGVVYDGDRAAQTGEQIKGYHNDDQGRGRRRPALPRAESRDVLLGARHLLHADHQDRRVLLRRADRGREAAAVRRTRAVVPDVRHEHAAGSGDLGGVQEYWDAKCRDELEINRATLDIFTIRIPKPWFVLMPTPIWDQLFKPMVGAQRWIAAGLFDPAVREKAGMRWTPGDEVLLRVFGKLVELAFVAVPDEIRLHPRALSAYRRAQGKLRRRRAVGRGARVHGAAPRPPWPAHALRAAPQVAARPSRVAGAHHVLVGGAASGAWAR